MDISDKLRNEIESDVKRCEAQAEVNGSEALYDSIVAKYTVVDSNFKNGLPNMGKTLVVGREYDFRKDLNAVSEKLRMWLLANSASNKLKATTIANTTRDKVEEYIRRGEEIRIEEMKHAGRRSQIEYVRGPKYDAWMSEIKIFSDRNLNKHPLSEEIVDTYFCRKSKYSSCNDMLGHLRALASDNEFLDSQSIGVVLSKPIQRETEGDKTAMNNKVFIVHGHDEGATQTIARALEGAGLEVIILHEQASGGKTIIEKIEANNNVSFAVVLYTPCDLGRSVQAQVDDEKNRARQNVVFEHGYLIGKLGREKVCALVKGDVETPGDISGVVYIAMDEKGAWKMELAKEMGTAGLAINEKFYH